MIKRGSESNGGSNPGHGDKTWVPYQCTAPRFVIKLGNNTFILFFWRGPIMKNRYVIHLFLFDLELNYVIGISSSYELRIWWFIFLNFYKIRICYFVAFIYMLIAISWLFLYDMFYSNRIENWKSCFSITIANITWYVSMLLST